MRWATHDVVAWRDTHPGLATSTGRTSHTTTTRPASPAAAPARRSAVLSTPVSRRGRKRPPIMNPRA